MRYLIVGAGFSGAVLARQLVENLDCTVQVVDERPHVAGNCHTERDAATGVMVHTYGPHIFNTDNQRVWEYVQRFGVFHNYVSRIKAINKRGVFSLPVNLFTINQLFGKTFSPTEAQAFVASLADPTITAPKNFEEQALAMLGRELYEAFFYGYTLKQWGCEPRELPASILKRLPVRFNYDDNYYAKQFQGIPDNGYSAIVEGILKHPNISVSLNTPFSRREIPPGFDHIFYTGPLDAYFEHERGRLGYRTVFFERIEAEGDYQGTAIINYTEASVPWTRIHEHKHFTPWESHARTVAFKEFSKETGPTDVPYYPKRLARDMEILASYEALAAAQGNVSFLGRLGTYRYMDMETVIGEALEFGERCVAKARDRQALPVFSNKES